MNGRIQVEQYAALAGNQFRPGDLVDVRQLGRCEVLEALPDGVVRIRTAERCPVLVKAIVCRRVK